MHPFIAINCAGPAARSSGERAFRIRERLLHGRERAEKGTFRKEADGGTLVLDEIGDMDISLQAKLLRVLENRTIRRIGGSKEIPFDVMVIATTNRDLNALQAEGKFRQDLFFRLNMFSIKVPPLRERKEDIPLLAEHFFSSCKKSSVEGTCSFRKRRWKY